MTLSHFKNETALIEPVRQNLFIAEFKTEGVPSGLNLNYMSEQLIGINPRQMTFSLGEFAGKVQPLDQIYHALGQKLMAYLSCLNKENRIIMVLRLSGVQLRPQYEEMLDFHSESQKIHPSIMIPYTYEKLEYVAVEDWELLNTPAKPMCHGPF